ncbi:ABC transporter related protein [Olsenella uli DSM 7084]|uniref:Fatty acid ABC transporter ATP-binding/permease protein n=1 Tax=Olsenella uli (strain ATCC 49627 / DSM 7084 / CCUG 31166 / CIP 109912 / JCM 12494 / LMG 11480 / NCIMB 702895 / VPI D76D-27C) TaxID=633147 RepID=E1QZM3_OLSUV|nr:ABC transporter related protein [Olsenella uli DSM 7084]KRO13372.1 ABC transporter [Olsenella uli DSM 7084]
MADDPKRTTGEAGATAKRGATEAQAPRGGKGRGPSNPMATLRKVMGMVFSFYPAQTIVIVICIVAAAILTSLPSIYMQQALVVVGKYWQAGDWASALVELTPLMTQLVIIYAVAITCNVVQTQLSAVVTQGTLMKTRNAMFDHMEDLPISYFDTNKHGDIMSHYTNDVDTLRQLISQALPNLLTMFLQMASVLFIMLWYSVPLSLVVLAMVAFMGWLVRLMGGRSAHFFLAQQVSIAKAEGFAEESMNGQKVVKVFTHEPQMERDFDKVNEELFQASKAANIYGNTLGPILFNIGNLAYVLVALAGSVFMSLSVPNLSISGLALTIDIVVPYLNLTKRFAGSIGQVSQQINFVVMGLAGAERIFGLMGEEPESDEGYVTLVNARRDAQGELVETGERTDLWAWKHPHHDGSVTYTPLKGDVRLTDVDFGYTPDHTVLHGVSLFAKPGQKVAFVGATGAGKTTITNLINRFYDIADGKIRYDGININKIRKADLRRSLGIVLQDVNLFTGTVMDNIRYGRLTASDGECIAAAKLAGADSFIERLPEGYDTMLTDNAASLSQGQRQLLSIARAAVANPPAMILDEATSSIDTRTEAIVQRGMDALMQGRTTFVIAHRLSTVRNSDVIIVLDHGRIIERGTHDELITQRGTYYQLYTGAFELE